MKRLSILCLLFFLAGAFCTPVHALDGIFLGLGAEANANTREGAAAGGWFIFGFDLDQRFALGAKIAYYNNFDTVSNIEPIAFFRWYLPLPIKGLFLQAELGATIFFEFDRVIPAPLYGLAAGWRFDLGKMFFIEPSIRGGYPFAWGAGFTFGIRIPNKGKGEGGEEL